ncbi:acyl-CoA thioesterase [Maribellus maritimus]|uniref:acyl-CoA thioesterase n=1 Tax=Maribellus maritimus TaxID=2870838 RepID=UPI001EEBFA38|nr:thioesterase family protein [Maribellus maritimus]MCG6190409.1 acyl-CoA thioesterase [Maribellus maritimus]
MNKLVYEEKVYTYHIDIVGHVNNIIYIQWLENGRVKLLEAMGIPVTDLTRTEGIVPILTETNILYKKPFFIHNSVHIETWVSKLNNASAILEFRFYNEKDELCASAWQKGLFINMATMKPARLSDKHREAFEKYLVNE